MFEVSFPGLGIGPIEINSTAFTVFGHPVAWYGIIIAIGMVTAFFIAQSRAKIEGIKSDDIIDLALFLLIAGIVGARLYYVIFKFDDFLVTGGSFAENLFGTLANIVAVWNGGLAIFGGLILGFVTVLIVARHKKIRLPILLDSLSPSVLIGQSIGRWGNFMNAEAYGSATDLPWRMGINEIKAGGLYTNYFEVHPTFLYESLWNLIGFVIMMIFYKKKKFHGQMFYMYMIWYGFGRFFIEGLRSDSLYLVGELKVSQLVAALIFVAGIALSAVSFVKLKKNSASEINNDEIKTDKEEN